MPDARRMSRSSFPRSAAGRGGCGSAAMLVLSLLLSIGDVPFADGSCEFPAAWAGEWYQYGEATIIVNATALGERTCIERSEHSYIVHSEDCYRCIIVNDRHENVIQFREAYCLKERTSLRDMCSIITSDDNLSSMFRVNSKPIPCPFAGSSFTFAYDKGYGECAVPISLAEKCTDESKLLLKYQACPDVKSESNTEELQCLAVWNDGRNKYLVGTLKGLSVETEKTYRCFLYEERTHHQGKTVYLLAQSGEPTCNGLTTVSEGSPSIKLAKVDKEHTKCKYPSWITEHHDWHSLDGAKTYHFTNKNATLKVRAEDAGGDAFHEEKIVCHSLEKLHPAEGVAGQKVKLIAHVTSGCDIGYVCMIFHKRDQHVIELQQSAEKAIMPDEACSMVDAAAMPYTTLISSSLRQRKCPNTGRYLALGSPPFRFAAASFRRERRSENRSAGLAKRRGWPEDAGASEPDDPPQEQQQQQQRDHHHHQHHHHHRQHRRRHEETEQRGDECESSGVRIGCGSAEQNEIAIEKSCDGEETTYRCHGSWEERGTWYTIVSPKSEESSPSIGETFCFSMGSGGSAATPSGNGNENGNGRGTKRKLGEQEVRFARLDRVCRSERGKEYERSYALVDQGVCEDARKAASNFAPLLPSLSGLLLVGTSIGSCIGYIFLLLR